MRKFGRSLLSFQGLVWTLAFVAITVLVAFPLVKNLWAYYTWIPVPCWYGPSNARFFFERDGASYYGECHDFWDAYFPVVSRATGQSKGHPTDSLCYVNPGTPKEGVAALDVHKRWDRAIPRLSISAMILVAAALLSYASKSKTPSIAQKNREANR